LALGGWLVTYENKRTALRIEPGHSCPSPNEIINKQTNQSTNITSVAEKTTKL